MKMRENWEEIQEVASLMLPSGSLRTWDSLSITTQSDSHGSNILIQTNELGRKKIAIKLQNQLMMDGIIKLSSATLIAYLNVY